MKNCFLFDGQIYSKNSFEVGIYDRGFSFSDGFFETFYFDGHKSQNLLYHFNRIQEASSLYEISIPLDFLQSIPQKIDELNTNLTPGKKMFKLIIWRKQGGLYTPESNDFHFLITAREKITPNVDYLNNIGFEKIEGFTKNYFSGIKNLSCNQYLKAGMSIKKNNWNDCIIINHENHITESLYGNVFWYKNEKLYTPSLETGCVNGIIRRKFFSKMAIQEGLFTKENLLEADFVFLTNVGGIKIITELGKKVFQKNEILEKYIQEKHSE